MIFTRAMKRKVEAINNYVRYNFHHMISCGYIFFLHVCFIFFLCSMYFPFLIADCLRALVLQSGPDFPLLRIPQALVFPLGLSSSVMIVNIQDGEEECEVEARRTWRMTSQSALVVSNLGLPNCIDMI